MFIPDLLVVEFLLVVSIVRGLFWSAWIMVRVLGSRELLFGSQQPLATKTDQCVLFVNALEDVLEAPIVFLEDGVLGAKVQGHVLG